MRNLGQVLESKEEYPRQRKLENLMSVIYYSLLRLRVAESEVLTLSNIQEISWWMAVSC